MRSFCARRVVLTSSYTVAQIKFQVHCLFKRYRYACAYRLHYFRWRVTGHLILIPLQSRHNTTGALGTKFLIDSIFLSILGYFRLGAQVLLQLRTVAMCLPAS